VEPVNNLTAWLTTVVSRVCLDMLRSRASRGQELAGYSASGEHEDSEPGGDPEEEAVLLDSVGRALLVVLNTRQPAERIAFVLHDMFTVPFNGIAPILGRSPAAAKKLASRARHKVRSRPSVRGTQLARHPRVVEAFLAASRAGDLEAWSMRFCCGRFLTAHLNDWCDCGNRSRRKAKSASTSHPRSSIAGAGSQLRRFGAVRR
jgi:hypothetical protein